MTFIVVISLISLILDGFLTNYLPYLPGNLSLFTPMLTLVSIFLIYPLFKGEDKKYYIYIFIYGIIYDLFYTNLFLFDAILFLFIGYITYLIYRNFEVTKIRLLLYVILIISIYEISFSILLIVFNLVSVTPYKVIYKIIHSLIINLIYGELIFLIIDKLMPKKLHTRKINGYNSKI